MVYFIPKEEKRAGNSALFYAYLLSHGSTPGAFHSVLIG